MSWVDDAVGTFGREMGFARLRLPEQGAVELAFENRGTLALERAGDDLLLYQQRQRQHRGIDRLSRAMDLCHWRHDRNPAVRAGVKDDRLVLLIRLREREVTPEAMAQAFERLVRLMDEIES